MKVGWVAHDRAGMHPMHLPADTYIMVSVKLLPFIGTNVIAGGTRAKQIGMYMMLPVPDDAPHYRFG